MSATAGTQAAGGPPFHLADANGSLVWVAHPSRILGRVRDLILGRWSGIRPFHPVLVLGVRAMCSSKQEAFTRAPFAQCAKCAALRNANSTAKTKRNHLPRRMPWKRPSCLPRARRRGLQIECSTKGCSARRVCAGYEVKSREEQCKDRVNFRTLPKSWEGCATHRTKIFMPATRKGAPPAEVFEFGLLKASPPSMTLPAVSRDT